MRHSQPFARDSQPRSRLPLFLPSVTSSISLAGNALCAVGSGVREPPQPLSSAFNSLGMLAATSQGKLDNSVDPLDRDSGVPSCQPLACATPPTEPCFSPRLELALHDPGVRGSPAHLLRARRIEPPGMPASCAPLANMKFACSFLHGRPIGSHPDPEQPQPQRSRPLAFPEPFVAPHHLMHLQPVSRDLRHKTRGYWDDIGWGGEGGVRGCVWNPVRGETWLHLTLVELRCRGVGARRRGEGRRVGAVLAYAVFRDRRVLCIEHSSGHAFLPASAASF